jgi:hypothetical protein
MDLVDASSIIRIASNVSVILPLIVYLSRIRHASSRVHIIGVLVIVSAISDLVGLFLYKQNQPTVILFNSYYAILFFLLTWFYYEVLFINSRRIILWVGLAIYLQSFILVTLYVQSFFEYQTLMWVITAIIMIIYSTAYFFYSLSAIPASNIFNYTFMWINTAVLIYFCLNLFLFAMGSHVLTKLDRQMSMMLWSSHNVNNIIKNILFAIGIYLYKKKATNFS